MATNKNDLVNNALGKIKTSPGFGGRIGAGIGYVGTMDYIDTDNDGIDDRNQRGPGQPYITFEKATQEEKNRFNQPRGKGVDQGGKQPRGNYAKNYMDSFAGSAKSQTTKVPKDFGTYNPASFGGGMYN